MTHNMWKEYLASTTLNTLPADFTASESKVVESQIVIPLNSETKQALAHLSSQFDCCEYTIVLALFCGLVSRLSGDEDIVLGSCLPQGRSHCVTRAAVQKTTKLADLVNDVKQSFKIASEHPALHSDLRTLLGGSERFRTLVLNGPLSSLSHFGFRDLTLVYEPEKFTVVYNSVLYKRQRIQLLCDEFSQLIELASKQTSEPVDVLSLLTKSQLDILPDPKADLNWSGFRGAIQDIFAANAEKWPERECVIETENKFVNSPKRVFTYKHIHEASNVVAHHLISNGIKVDDVVMVYAHRSVDLVIAIMGVLKAGATFSVIDPAYPAARQNIYLSVAKPVGLVVLSRAGKLSPVVREYIDTNLKLKCEITDLTLEADGKVSAQQKLNFTLAGKHPGVKVGPDHHPTLSFTSGSEGVPKGVRGRHFSLAYYFPWMGQTFGIGENDRFTMLSGIAHDPIQRDIFTPLFFGAKLYVPSTEDIGTPGRLAEWMAETGCSVTHLTPAMGQLLSAQASAKIPDLKNAFFVGDILTKRECLKLQSLAANTAIINMYGTTETQRAVSYFRVPSYSENPRFLASQRDVIPAGKGMLDVQLLIVNRNEPTTLCGVGEIGEIYVRAGGLSDGYLGLPDMTDAKFLTSWFSTPKQDVAPYDGWLGARDRLYKTGDLGRYMPDGNVEVSGRADDQIKIRGFRIELGEINTHLGKHPLVRESVTLVRRDKDEEPILVAYVVPEQQAQDEMFSAHESIDEDGDDEDHDVIRGLVEYQRLIRDAKKFLKTKLPSYAIPSLIVPLTHLPLNPNGKIDKPRLPFPDTAQMEMAARHFKNQNKDAEVSAWSPTEVQVRELWFRLFATKPPAVDLDDSFFDLGGHSILATKMIFEARSEFSLPDLPLGAVFESPTIRGFANLIDDLRRGDDVLANPKDKDSAGSGAGAPGSSKKVEPAYSEDAFELAKSLPKYITPTGPVPGKFTVFLTGSTGFLGAFILRDLLNRESTQKVYVQVRAKSKEHALERVINTGKAYGIWKDEFTNRIEAVAGSLEDPKLGADDETWDKLVNEVDTIIHNGALVHWVYPYSTLRGPNVLGTLNVMALASQGKPKYYTFVSSTSVLDTQHYIDLSDHLIEKGRDGIYESDDLMGSVTGLGTGYGQSKWAAEYLAREAGAKLGLRGAIVRPGYILGDSETGVSNTDDFLLRMLKGCEELGMYPMISNTVNMVPVDHVARVVCASALNGHALDDVSVVHVTSHPRITFDVFLSSLNKYGYDVKECEYMDWCDALEKYVLERGDSALFPLLHFVLSNLPQDTKAPELDDSNARAVLRVDRNRTNVDKSEGAAVTVETVGTYLSFLTAIGFIAKPQESKIPEPKVSDEILRNFSSAGGRGH